jgi:transposase InsO family protein
LLLRTPAPQLRVENPPVGPYFSPSQLLDLEMLRRPLEPKQYLSIRYTERLAEAGIEPSVGNVGDSYDNALAETIIGLYKTEVIRRNGPWRNIEEVEFATLEWVDWFNNRRLLEPVGNIPPAEFEALYYANNEAPALMAGPT